MGRGKPGISRCIAKPPIKLSIKQHPVKLKEQVLRVMFLDLGLHIFWISPLVTWQLELPMKSYVLRNQFVSCLSLFNCWTYLWFIASYVNMAPSSVAQASAKTAVHIMIGYGALLDANTRYISLIIIPITILVFIGAVFVKVSMKGSLNFNKEKNTEASKAYGGSGASSGGDNNGGSGMSYNDGLNATAILPVLVLFLMARFNVENMVVSQFLLFLTSALGELALLMERLHSEVSPAFRVIRRASLVVVLLTAHTMAAELLGDEVLLVCTPELIAVLLWFIIYFVRGGGPAAAVISVNNVTSRKAGILVLGAVLACLRASRDESAAGKMILVFRYLVPGAFSVILPYLCVFTLREWPTTAAMLPSELKGAIQLLSFCGDTMLTAAALFLLVTLVLDGRMDRLQELLADKAVNKVVYSNER